MSDKPRRDPDTGKIHTSPKIDAVFDWLRWAMPVIVIPIVLWAFSVQMFISKGPRYTLEQADLAHSELRAEFDAKIATLPPAQFRAEVHSIETKVDSNAHELSLLREQVGRIDERTLAIQRILEDR